MLRAPNVTDKVGGGACDSLPDLEGLFGSIDGSERRGVDKVLMGKVPGERAGWVGGLGQANQGFTPRMVPMERGKGKM